MMESTSTQQTYSPHPTVQAQEPDWEIQELQEHHHHHHHQKDPVAAILTDHHPREDPVAAVPTDHRQTEESEEEHLEPGLSPTGSILQRDTIPTQWTTFMRRL